MTVRLTRSRRRLSLEITDDGVGFDPTQPSHTPAGALAGRAQGLENMRRRAELLGARLHVRSALAQGTSLSLTMPVTAVRHTR